MGIGNIKVVFQPRPVDIFTVKHRNAGRAPVDPPPKPLVPSVFARKADCAAIAEIYNHAVLYTAAIWNDQTVDADNRIAWFEARTLAGYSVLVSEENGVVTGYASFGDWRSFDGFRHTVEHSVYVHPDHQGKGLGRKLLSRLIDEARDCGKHVMVAGIESQNQASLHLHQSLGFVVTAQMPQVGTKIWSLAGSDIYAVATRRAH